MAWAYCQRPCNDWASVRSNFGQTPELIRSMVRFTLLNTQIRTSENCLTRFLGIFAFLRIKFIADSSPRPSPQLGEGDH
jgi:hypothetical protein